MTPDTVMTIARDALWVTTLLAAPMLLMALATGLFIGMFQAATQINEMTLSFIPKLIVLVLVLAVAGPWMLDLIMTYTRNHFESIPSLLG
ncbi:MAG: flagellar biosynthesis protein FliQ [Gammaproteobacteria bacterium]|nr:flagellar biosynthesis protein FliQ [Gammaproteobacteria bacterium]